MENLPSLPAAPVAWTPGGPWRPRAALTLGAWYMLREMEFSNAEIRSFTLNMVRSTVTLALPASKADPFTRDDGDSWVLLLRSAQLERFGENQA